MNLDRFRIKAKDKYGYWCIGRLERNATESTKADTYYGVVWYREDMYGIHVYHTIDPETLCQCTGIQDSDGKLIYENDILSVEKPGEEPEKAKVIFSESDNSMIVEMRGVKFYWLSRFVWRVRRDNWKIKVIGNKFDKEKTDD